MNEIWAFPFGEFWAIVYLIIILVVWYRFDKRVDNLKEELRKRDRIIARLQGKTEEQIKERERWNEMTEKER